MIDNTCTQAENICSNTNSYCTENVIAESAIDIYDSELCNDYLFVRANITGVNESDAVTYNAAESCCGSSECQDTNTNVSSDPKLLHPAIHKSENNVNSKKSDVVFDGMVQESQLFNNEHVVGNAEDVKLSENVMSHGYPNVYGARIPLSSKWNLELFSTLLEGYHDREVVEFLLYGWPANRLPTMPSPTISHVNHKSATDHPDYINKYI